MAKLRPRPLATLANKKPDTYRVHKCTRKKKSKAAELDPRLVHRTHPGYRRYKDGSLNVGSLGREVEIFEEDQRLSWFLRFPSEIRNKIYHLVFGGKLMVFRHFEKGNGKYIEVVGS